MSNAIDTLNNIAHQIRSQDNAYTSYPIYTVQEQVRITGIDTDYTEDVIWIDDNSEEVGDDPDYDQPTAAQLEAQYDETCEIPDGYTRTGYVTQWRQRECFLTMEAAETYIASNKHRHEGELRLYIESGYRNPEWKELRRLMAGPLLDCLFALQDVTEELRQLHAHHYGSCEGGCPANSYLEKAKQVLANLDTYKDPYA